MPRQVWPDASIGGPALRIRRLDRRDLAACLSLIAGPSVIRAGAPRGAARDVRRRIAARGNAQAEGVALGLAVIADPDGSLIGWIDFALVDGEEPVAELRFCFDGGADFERIAEALIDAAPRAVRLLRADLLFAQVHPDDAGAMRLVGRLGLKPRRGARMGARPIRFQRDLALIL